MLDVRLVGVGPGDRRLEVFLDEHVPDQRAQLDPARHLASVGEDLAFGGHDVVGRFLPPNPPATDGIQGRAEPEDQHPRQVGQRLDQRECVLTSRLQDSRRHVGDVAGLHVAHLGGTALSTDPAGDVLGLLVRVDRQIGIDQLEGLIKSIHPTLPLSKGREVLGEGLELLVVRHQLLRRHVVLPLDESTLVPLHVARQDREVDVVLHAPEIVDLQSLKDAAFSFEVETYLPVRLDAWISPCGLRGHLLHGVSTRPFDEDFRDD